MEIEKQQINKTFILFMDYLREEYTTPYNQIYRSIGISTSKGAKIRAGALNATKDDLLRMIEIYPALVPMAEKEGLPVGGSGLTDAEKLAFGLAELKRLKGQIDDLQRFLRSK
jgi:hypothetical protein